MRSAPVAALLALAVGCAAERAPVATPTPTPFATTPSASPTPSRTASTSPTPTPRTYVSRPVLFPGPAELARALSAAETAIRSPRTSAVALERAGYTQQRAYRQVVTTQAWRADVRRRLPAALRPAFDSNVSAGTELRAATKPRDALPEWRIVPAPPAAELRRYYVEAERAFGIDWTYLAAIHLVESRMGRLRGTSTAGARGPMQFIPSTWAQYGRGDIENPRDAILAAARYLVARGGRQDIARGLYGYNPSDHYVRAVSAYARVMQADERAYLGYYHWQVYYRMVGGDVVLEVGYRG